MFLVWWYTQGIYSLLQRIHKRISDLVRALHLKKLLHYLFVPMYGYGDIWSRLISFPVRLVQLILLLSYALLYIFFEITLVLIWSALPLVIIINVVYQLLGLW